MKSIVTTYPDFQALPKGIKRMLVTSESVFFEEARPATRMTAIPKSILPAWETAEALDQQAEVSA